MPSARPVSLFGQHACLPNRIDPEAPVIMKNILSFIATRQDMIQPTRIPYTLCSADEDTSMKNALSDQAFYSLCKM